MHSRGSDTDIDKSTNVVKRKNWSDPILLSPTYAYRKRPHGCTVSECMTGSVTEIEGSPEEKNENMCNDLWKCREGLIPIVLKICLWVLEYIMSIPQFTLHEKGYCSNSFMIELSQFNKSL